MSVFGPAPIEPRGPQAGLAAAALHARPNDKQKAAIDADQRMRDALAHRVAGAESEHAVREAADRHDEDERKRDEGKGRKRRDGRGDSVELSQSADAPNTTHPQAATPSAAPNGRPRLDVRG
jgi:hypothetical protein